MKTIKYIDLFSGMGGIALGFNQAMSGFGHETECVLYSDPKKAAVESYRHNLLDNPIYVPKVEDITEIPDFDYLLAGFPCQSFSMAGNRAGFDDVRGTAFFHIANILKKHKPKGFLLENVEGLVNHDNGNTFRIIIDILSGLGYDLAYQVINAAAVVPQRRKRIYIIGKYSPDDKGVLSINPPKGSFPDMSSIMEKGDRRMLDTGFTRKLLKHYKPLNLAGKSMNDRRHGPLNIHSWDVGLKGETTPAQKRLMFHIMRMRRSKVLAKKNGVPWADGMPVLLKDLLPLGDRDVKNNVENDLNQLVKMGYLQYGARKIVVGSKRVKDKTMSDGYRIMSGALSFEIQKFYGRENTANTLTATGADRIAFVTEDGIHRPTRREYLRLFGYPETYKIPDKITDRQFYDLIGNTVVVPIVKHVAEHLFDWGK